EVCDVVLDRIAHEDDSLLEQPRVDVVGALPPAGGFDDHRYEHLVPPDLGHVTGFGFPLSWWIRIEDLLRLPRPDCPTRQVLSFRTILNQPTGPRSPSSCRSQYAVIAGAPDGPSSSRRRDVRPQPSAGACTGSRFVPALTP